MSIASPLFNPESRRALRETQDLLIALECDNPPSAAEFRAALMDLSQRNDLFELVPSSSLTALLAEFRLLPAASFDFGAIAVAPI